MGRAGRDARTLPAASGTGLCLQDSEIHGVWDDGHAFQRISTARAIGNGFVHDFNKVVFGCSHEAARSGHERGLSLLCKQAKQTRSACVALIRFL